MNRASAFARHAVRYAAGALWSFAIWTVWLALLALAAAQVYVASTNELVAPDFLIRGLEARLAQSGINVRFDRTLFDPTGRILLQSPRVFLSGFSDPVVTARAAYVRVNPVLLAIGRVEVRQVRILEGTVSVPAMISPSGRPEPVLRDVDLQLDVGENDLAIRHATGRLGRLLVSVHGLVHTPSERGQPPAALSRELHARFRDFCRLASDLTRRLDVLQEPSLDLTLAPAAEHGVVATAEFDARGLRLLHPYAIDAGPVHVTTRVPLFGPATTLAEVHLAVDSLQLPRGIEARTMNALVRARVQSAGWHVDPVDLHVDAGNVVVSGIAVGDVAATVRPMPLPALEADVIGRILGAPLRVRATANLQSRTASLRFAGRIAPEIVDLVSARTHVDVGRFFRFDRLAIAGGRAELGPGWKPRRLSARVALRGIHVHGVLMDEASATVELDPRRFVAPVAYARIGPNFAQGSYEQDLATRQFRFLLDGRLRPMAIAPWFHPWWPKFFSRFEFPVAPPVASVDVQGVWREGLRTSVFVYVDADRPTVLTAPFRHVTTRLFVRPGFYDDLGLHATALEGGAADGRFTVTSEVGTGKWRSIDVDATSTVPLALALRAGGVPAEPILGPFQVTERPSVSVRGHFDGPAMNGARHRSVDVQVRAPGPFSYHGFPLRDVAFTALLRDENLTLDNFVGTFAGGTARLHARVWGAEPKRHLGFDASLTGASLGQAVDTIEGFVAKRQGRPRTPPGKFVQEKSKVRLDLAASADGMYSNLLSFHGNGNAELQGAELGEVPLLGLLSQLLKFTALRFTTARANFTINGPRLEFPEVALRGANSAIDAHGAYELDRRQLDFRAKVFPFQESGSVLKSMVGAVLTPLSNALEVKLTGTLAKPDWAFVIGPTNLLRSLASGPEAAGGGPEPAAKTPGEPAGTGKPAAAPPAAGGGHPSVPPASSQASPGGPPPSPSGAPDPRSAPKAAAPAR